MSIEDHAQAIADLLKIIANEHRILILCALRESVITVSEIHKHLPSISQSALSQHLSQLRISGILSATKVGQYVHYRIADKRILKLLHVLRSEYCRDTMA